MRSLIFERPLVFALLATAVVSGCVPDLETDLSALREPRLLAIAASPPETQARKKTTLSALVATPPGTSVSPLAWRLCIARKPLTELGPVNQDCLDPAADSETVLDLGRGDSAEVTLDQDVCKVFGPLRPTPAAGEPAGRPVDPDITGGFYQPVVAELAGVTSLGSIRIDCDPTNLNRDDALAFRQQYRVNENPQLRALSISKDGAPSTDLTNDSSAVAVKAGTSVDFRATWDDCPDASECGDGYCTANEDATSCAADCTAGQAHGCTGAERFVWYNREKHRIEARREGISVAWYSSGGHFDSEQTGLAEAETASRQQTDNTWRVGSNAGPATVWLVIRDTRGGQSWKTFHFDVSP
jgi:hypothetical protein